MINGIKQQQNGEIGELRTRAILAKGFFVLRRNVDVDGADLLVQKLSTSTKELRTRHAEILGVVQAKFFEGTNQVRILRSYVEDSERPRSDFFAILHTDGDCDEDIYYFFTALQIVDFFYLSKCGLHYCFNITTKRDYSAFKNLPKSSIYEVINYGLKNTEIGRNNAFLASFYRLRGAVRMSVDESYVYMLRVLEGTPVVLVKPKDSEEANILEPRPDLYTYSGGFAWGYAGTGPQFLCASILGHHLCGRSPTGTEREMLLRKIVEVFPRGSAFEDTAFNISTEMINKALENDTDKYATDYVNFVQMFSEEYGILSSTELADEMIKLIGASTISFLSAPNVDAICLDPDENFLKIIKDEKGKTIPMKEKLSGEKINRFISAAVIYSGQPLNTSNPSVWFGLPSNQFKGAWIQITIPPITKSVSFCINTKRRVQELENDEKIFQSKLSASTG